MFTVSGILEEIQRSGDVPIGVGNTTLPSVKSWLAARLPIFYHNIGSISPSCPTLAKSKGVGLCLPQNLPRRCPHHGSI